jgi:hypothetical protein
LRLESVVVTCSIVALAAARRVGRGRALRLPPPEQPAAGDLPPARYGTIPGVLRWARPSELDLMARLAGLRLRERWGGWRREPFDAASRWHVSVYELPDEKRSTSARA